MPIFLICGYGIPANLRTDQNYLTYLHLAFNHVYDTAAGQPATIIPCGGPTNCTPPYEGTEAEAIAGYFRELMDREPVRAQTAGWIVRPETRSLSTLENFVFAKELIGTEMPLQDVTAFCEKTREKRVTTLAARVFEGSTVRVIPIDFDQSKNRYLDKALLQEKEASGIKEGLWTLDDPERLAKHHALFEQKLAFLRRRQTEGLSHVDAVREWSLHGQEILRELMPDHPLFEERT